MEKLYTPEEVAEIIKMKYQTVLGYLRNKKIPSIKVGSEYRIKESDLRVFLSYPQE